MADSQTTIVGGLGKPPELRFTQGGQAICSFGVAVSRRWQDKQTQEWKEETSWFNVVAWGQLGENCAATLDKGTRVVVTGRLTQRSWETPDGDKRSAVEIIADAVGPDLRWATATVARNERTDSTTNSAPAAANYGDEEPF